MYIVSVIPIVRSLKNEELTYVSAKKFDAGSIVLIPIRNKKVPGIIISSEDASKLKSEIKTLPFTIKKLEAAVETKISSKLVSAAKKIAREYATTTGAVLGHFINTKNISLLKNNLEEEKNKNSGEFAIQATYNERVKTYRSIIRECFAKKKSIFLMLPTEEKAEKIFKEFSKGIEEFSILFHNNLSKKIFKNSLSTNNESKHPLLIVGTYSFIPYFRKDISTIIIENEASRFYFKDRRPYIDMRDFVSVYAKDSEIRIIRGDNVLQTETHQKILEGKIYEYDKLSTRINHRIQTVIVDTKKEEGEEKKFAVISPELDNMISFAIKNKSKLFIFALRKGHSPETVCRDCGKTVLCKQCEAPVVLHNSIKGRTFICHHCGSKRSAEEKCQECESWRLTPLGIGIEKIEEEIIKKYKINPIILGATTETKKEMEEKISKINSDNNVVLGAEKSIDYFDDYFFEYVAIASMDSLFSLPDFQIKEKIFGLITSLKNKASDCILIQGRNVKDDVIDQAISGEIGTFIKKELLQRKTWNYPPFVKFIKITVSLPKESLKKELRKLNEFLKEYKPIIFPAFIKTKREKSISHILLKIEKEKWPDKKLIEKLLALPPYVEVRVNPQSLL